MRGEHAAHNNKNSPKNRTVVSVYICIVTEQFTVEYRMKSCGITIWWHIQLFSVSYVFYGPNVNTGFTFGIATLLHSFPMLFSPFTQFTVYHILLLLF